MFSAWWTWVSYSLKLELVLLGSPVSLVGVSRPQVLVTRPLTYARVNSAPPIPWDTSHDSELGANASPGWVEHKDPASYKHTICSSVIFCQFLPFLYLWCYFAVRNTWQLYSLERKRALSFIKNAFFYSVLKSLERKEVSFPFWMWCILWRQISVCY